MSGEMLQGAALLLLFQHVKPTFQKKYVNLFRDAVNEGEAQLRFLALLEDSLLRHEGKPQKYRSQLMRDEELTLKLWPN